ncbi:Dehydrogenase, myo-inositol 2-dehydrogenase, partial [human gut metagenome]
MLGEVNHINARYWCDYGCDPSTPMAWATIVSLSLMMFLLLCVADARCLSALRKEKRRSTD